MDAERGAAPEGVTDWNKVDHERAQRALGARWPARDVLALWKAHGGEWHGPHVETVTMPMYLLSAFLDAYAAPRAADPGDEIGRDRFRRLLVAFHDATRRPLGVTPASGDEFYDWRLAEAAEERRPRIGTELERRERLEVRLVATQREKAAAVGLLDEQAFVVRQLEGKLAAAEARAEAAEGERDAARAVLRRVEWVRDSFGGNFCPACERYEQHGHASDCQIAAQIGATAREGGAVDETPTSAGNASGINSVVSTTDPTTPGDGGEYGR